MTDLNNMRISDEELENVIGGKTTSLLSPCMFGVHERPMWDTIFAFSTEDHEYWHAKCARCGKTVYTKEGFEISKKAFYKVLSS